MSLFVAINKFGEIRSPCLTRISIGVSSETWLSMCVLAVTPVLSSFYNSNIYTYFSVH